MGLDTVRNIGWTGAPVDKRRWEDGMAAGYRLFYVSTWETLPDKGVAARAWYEQARELWARLPGVQSIDAYVQQFSLGSARDQLEIWAEIDNYEVLDRWDNATGAMGDEFIALNKVAAECVRQGPARLVGDYVGSALQDLQKTT